MDAVFQGDLFDGEAAWAAGYQYRKIRLESDLDDLINVAINPCSFAGQTDCASQTGRRSFLLRGVKLTLIRTFTLCSSKQRWMSAKTLDLQLAVRYEDYGDADTFDPKLAGRYTINEMFSLRGSVQTTFRGPDLDAV